MTIVINALNNGSRVVDATIVLTVHEEGTLHAIGLELVQKTAGIDIRTIVKS